MDWIDTKIDDYYKWLRDNTIIKKCTGSDWYEITTPFTGLFNDYIQIYIKKDDGKIILSDDSEILGNLELNGVDICSSPRRKALMDSILLNYGVDRNESELSIIADERNFPEKKHALISALCEISNLYVTASNNTTSCFHEDVQKYFDEIDVVSTPSFRVRGRTGLDFNFDFQIAHKSKEILIKTASVLKQNTVMSFLFGWDDVQRTREDASGKNIDGIMFVNDSIEKPKDKFIKALENREAKVVLWSQRDSHKDFFVA